jgi:cyclic pyranopterin phosphate synthase
VARIQAEMPLVEADANYRGEVAERWAYADGSGEIGVIASVTQAFCRDCTRARLSTEGKLYTCLFANEGFDLREVIRAGGDDEALQRAVAAIWRQRSTGIRRSAPRTRLDRRRSR